MTFPKKTITAVVISIVILFVIYNARIAIINNVIKKELAPFQSLITCANFHLTTNLRLKVSHLCLQTPNAEFSINDMTLTFNLAASEKIKRIDIANIAIKGKTNLFEQSEPNENTPAISKAMLQKQLQQIATSNIPFDLTVSSLSYLPYFNNNHQAKTANQKVENQLYTGRLSVLNSNITLSLKDTKKHDFFDVNFSKSDTGTEQFKAEMTSNIASLVNFALKHKLPVSDAVTNNIKAMTVSGKLHTEISYQENLLSIKSRLNNFKLTTTDESAQITPITLLGELGINSEINFANHTESNTDNTELELIMNFLPKSKVAAYFNQQHVEDYVNNSSLPPELISLIKDNPITQLSLQPHGELTFAFNSQELTLAHIKVEANNSNVTPQNIELTNAMSKPALIKNKQRHSLTLDNIKLNFEDNLKQNSENHHKNSSDKNQQLKALNYVRANFSINSHLLTAAINNYSQAPVQLNLHGSVEKSFEKTSIVFAKGSTITANDIVIADKAKTAETRIKIKKIENKLLGEVQIQDSENIHFNLNINSQADNLRVANIIDIKKLTINSGITGELSDIKISASITADNVLLGNLTVSGELDKPTIAIIANQLPLTDLIALKIKLPAKISLVEGALSYSVKGQITDFNNIQNTPLAIAVAVTSLSGEIEGIWVQELYWQQNFNYVASKLTTADRHDKRSEGSNKDNLTVALIDTATPIARLSFNTHISYEKSFNFSASKLKGDILGGSFSIPKAQWPIEHGHSVNVQLTSIDLEQVLALDKKQGVIVTGAISGQLPIKFTDEKFTIKQGELHNVSKGLIQVINNPAVERLKASNSQLKLAFTALQNLHYHQLSSDVSMAEDGYMLLKTVIKGRNPDIDNDVNLNLNLSYDLPGLLESMSLTDKFEERIIKGLQKN